MALTPRPLGWSAYPCPHLQGVGIELDGRRRANKSGDRPGAPVVGRVLGIGAPSVYRPRTRQRGVNVASAPKGPALQTAIGSGSVRSGSLFQRRAPQAANGRPRYRHRTLPIGISGPSALRQGGGIAPRGRQATGRSRGGRAESCRLMGIGSCAASVRCDAR